MAQEDNIMKYAEEVLREADNIAKKYDQVSRAYINCLAEIKEARIDFNKQISSLLDRVDKLEQNGSNMSELPETTSSE